MTCPVCAGGTIILVSKKESDCVLRRRKCRECGYRFPTIEIDEDIYERRKEEQQTDAEKKLKEVVSAIKAVSGRLSELGKTYD